MSHSHLQALTGTGERNHGRQLLRDGRLGRNGSVAFRNAAETELPPVQRRSMAPRPLERSVWPRLARALTQRFVGQKQRKEVNWRRCALRRRLALACLVLGQTALATWSLTRTFPSAELSYLQTAILCVFAVLFSWISFSFWSNVAGFISLWRKAKFADSGTLRALPSKRLRARTAVLMPICEEDAQRCFRAIEAMCRSLNATGEGDMFDFFVLSDTANEQRRQEEQRQWSKTRRSLADVGRVFYRNRKLNIKRKSGNIADFLRRWSHPYEYMIVLDADSLMSGEAMVGLARAMEAAPQIGILQTTPTIVNADSLFARVQQFASRVYGPLFGASLHFWQLGESYYWGHNAIIRIAPFVNHCGLARLPGRPPLGGEILSHDFVEAALMGRADYEIWLALDLPGSYEESPPTLLDELKRDRRWCQGNLQHARLFLANGFKTGHRAIFVMGIMAYASALCWATFLLLTTIELAVETIVVPEYFSAKPSLFPIWPTWNPEWAIALASTTALLLFVPKLLSFLLIVRSGAVPRFGGAAKLGAGILLEIVISTLMAPSRMWFHAKFVAMTLLGREIKWHAQQRAGARTGWLEAVSAHGVSTLAAGLWLIAVYWLNPTGYFWLMPVAIPLILSIPLSVLSGCAAASAAARRLGLFAIPEEQSPPAILREFLGLASRPEANNPRHAIHGAIIGQTAAVARIKSMPGSVANVPSVGYPQTPSRL